MTIDGKKIAEQIIRVLRAKAVPRKYLCAIWVGENPASGSYLKQKEKTAHVLGVDFRVQKFPETISQEGLKQKIEELNVDAQCGGILLQLPLPREWDVNTITAAIAEEKDVDGIGAAAREHFAAGKGMVLPPAVGAFQKILDLIHQKIKGRKVAIVGPGFLVGKPIATWCAQQGAEVSIIDQEDSIESVKNAEVVVSGVGKAGLIRSSMLAPRTVMIDFGYAYVDGKLCGDFVCEGICTEVEWYTPTPGGTGPILVAQLFENFYALSGLKNDVV